MKTYQETIDFLFNSLPEFQRVGASAYKVGLGNALLLDEHLGSPHQYYNTIHVDGTNGKGSTSHLLAAVLQSAGYRVGLYTSPHLKDFRERIRVNGEPVSESYVVDFVNENKAFLDKIRPSFFEMTSAMAFSYFAEQKVDVAIIEVGLGGRLDSTNIITPILSIITNISLDHTGLLGDTPAKIAAEKAGIIKPNIPVVIGEWTDETRPVFEQKAEEMNVNLQFANSKYVNSNVEIGLLGSYQKKNTATVLTAIDVLRRMNFDISDNDIRKGFKEVKALTGLQGRWQITGTNPLIICDTGHNEAGIAYIVRQLRETPHEKLHIVFGVVKDKDVSSILALLPKNAQYYFTKADGSRSLDEKELLIKAKSFGLRGRGYVSVKKAFDDAKKNAGKDDLIFVGGSTFVVAEIL
jgi:dihydrofolate synthase/folylpolyglutamate synthase